MGRIKHISDASIHATLHLAAREPGKDFVLYDNYGNSCTLTRIQHHSQEFGYGDCVKIAGDNYTSYVIIEGTLEPQDTICALYLECILAISDDKQKISMFNTCTGKTEYYDYYAIKAVKAVYGQTIADYLNDRGLL